MHKTGSFTRRALLALLLAGLFGPGLVASAQAAPKKLLVVTVTKGFRHSSIGTAEKILGQLAESSGEFTVDYVRTDEEMATKMTADALNNYDGVIFANTTGDLPLPDKEAFLNWIKSGKAFIGMHSATDTFRGHKPLDSYTEMIGAEFKAHHAQAEVDCINQDPKNPACAPLPPTWHVKDEIYLMNGFERSKVHGLLSLDKHPNDKTPGDYPIAWTKSYGKGRVFYTSLGHREDLWDPNTPESFKRENSREVSEAYQKHIMGGIEWALNISKSKKNPAKISQ
jgi:type 1 glutamine amidotransferase